MGTLKVNKIDPVSGELEIGGKLIVKGDVVLQPTPTPTPTSPQNLYNSSCCVLVSSYCGIEVSCAGQLENGRPVFQFTFSNGESGIIIWYPSFSLSPIGCAWVLWDFPQTTKLAYLPINSTSPIGGLNAWRWIYNSQSLCLSRGSSFQTLPYNLPCITPTPTSSSLTCVTLNIQTNCGAVTAVQTGVLNGRPLFTYELLSFNGQTAIGGIIFWDSIISSWIVEETSNATYFNQTLPPGRVLQLDEQPNNPLPLPISTVLNPWHFVNGVSYLYYTGCYGQSSVAGLFITSLSNNPCPTPTPTSSPLSGNTLCGVGYNYTQQDTVMFSNGQVVITEMINGVETAVPGPNGLESTNYKIYINTVDGDSVELKPYFEYLIEQGYDIYLELCQNGNKAVYRITADSFVIQTEGLYSYMYTPRTSGTITQISYSQNDFVFDGDRSIIIDLDPIIPASPTPTPTITRTPIPSCGAGCYYYKLKNNTASSVTISYVDCSGNVITTQTNTAPYGTMFVCANARGITYYTQPWQLSYPQPILTWEVVGCCPTPTPTLTPTITKTPTRTPQPTYCSNGCYYFSAQLKPGQNFGTVEYVPCGYVYPNPFPIEYLHISGLTATTICSSDIVNVTWSAVTLTNLGCCPTPTPTRTPQPTPCINSVCYTSLVVLKPGETYAQIAYVACGATSFTFEYLYISGLTATTICSQDLSQGLTTMSALTFTALGCCPTPTATSQPTPTPTPTTSVGFVPPTPTPTITSTSTPTTTNTPTPTKTTGFVDPTPTPTVTSTSTPEPTNPQLCTCYDQTIYISRLDLNGAIGNDNEELNSKVFVDYINCGDLGSTTISFTDEGTYNNVICVSTTNQSKINVYYYNYNVIIGKGTVNSFVENSGKCCSIDVQPPDPEA